MIFIPLLNDLFKVHRHLWQTKYINTIGIIQIITETFFLWTKLGTSKCIKQNIMVFCRDVQPNPNYISSSMFLNIMCYLLNWIEKADALCHMEWYILENKHWSPKWQIYPFVVVHVSMDIRKLVALQKYNA